jgi:hypothetical protein
MGVPRTLIQICNLCPKGPEISIEHYLCSCPFGPFQKARTDINTQIGNHDPALLAHWLSLNAKTRTKIMIGAEWPGPQKVKDEIILKSANFISLIMKFQSNLS